MKPEALNEFFDIDEPVFTAKEIAKEKKLHPVTVRRLFMDEPGVIRLGHAALRGRKQRFTLRIPQSVAERVFKRMIVRSSSK